MPTLKYPGNSILHQLLYTCWPKIMHWPLLFDSCTHGRTHTPTRGRYHGGRRQSSDDSFHSPTVIPPSALDRASIMKRYHRRRTCSHTSPRRSPTTVTLHDTRFLSSADGGMTVGLWKLSSLDGRRPPWYWPQKRDNCIRESDCETIVTCSIISYNSVCWIVAKSFLATFAWELLYTIRT